MVDPLWWVIILIGMGIGVMFGTAVLIIVLAIDHTRKERR